MRRVGAIGSWVKTNSYNKKSKLLHLEDMIDSLDRMDSFTKETYYLQFMKVIEKTKFEKSLCEIGLFRGTLKCAQHRRTFWAFLIKKKIKIVLNLLKG